MFIKYLVYLFISYTKTGYYIYCRSKGHSCLEYVCIHLVIKVLYNRCDCLLCSVLKSPHWRGGSVCPDSQGVLLNRINNPDTVTSVYQSQSCIYWHYGAVSQSSKAMVPRA